MYTTYLEVHVHNPLESTWKRPTWKYVYKIHMEVHVQTHLEVHVQNPPGSICTKPTWKYMYETHLEVHVQKPPGSTCTKTTWKYMCKTHLKNKSHQETHVQNHMGSNVQNPPGSKCTKTHLEVNVQNPPGSTCTKPTWKYMYLFSKLQQDHQVSTITCLWRETQNVRLWNGFPKHFSTYCTTV